MTESFNEEVKAFRKACDDIRLKPPGPDKIRALQALSEKQRKKQAGRDSKGTTMKVIYHPEAGLLMDAADVLIGDVDLLMGLAEQIEEVLSQNQPLLQKVVESEKGCQEPEVSQEPLGVWVCYITDNYGDPIVVKLVSTDVQAMAWVHSKPRPVGVMDDETRGNRFVEYHTVEVERP